jgi:ribosomal-protein-alanine N-acetyltransferase
MDVLKTDRLVLRPLTMDDLDPLAAIYADPEVRRFFPEGTLTREETREELEWMIDVDYARYGQGLWATEIRETGALIGRCGLLPWRAIPAASAGLALDAPDEVPVPDAVYEVELAYLLARRFWGRGLGTEAARAIVDHGFDRLALPRLICLIDPGNDASLRVATNAGLTRDGDVEIDDETIPLYSISADRWRARRADRTGSEIHDDGRAPQGAHPSAGRGFTRRRRDSNAREAD